MGLSPVDLSALAANTRGWSNDDIIRLLIKQEKAAIMGVDADKSTDDNAFVDGWCTVLRGMNAATARDIVSPTMAEILTLIDRTWFQHSHNVVNLLIGQLKATLDGQPGDARTRTNKGKTGEKIGQTHHLMTIIIGQMKQNFLDHTSMLCSANKSRKHSLKSI